MVTLIIEKRDSRITIETIAKQKKSALCSRKNKRKKERQGESTGRASSPRADAGDDKRVLLCADYGHLRADGLADSYGRADERVKKSTKAPPPHHHYRQHRTDQRHSPRYNHPTISTR